MTMVKTLLLAVVIAILEAPSIIGTQVPAPAQMPVDKVTHFSKGFVLHSRSVVISGEQADVNETIGRIDLHGAATVRPAERPALQEVPATNAAGVPFPPVPPLVMHFTGKFRIGIELLTIEADEANVDARTGEMTLRGNVVVFQPLAPPR
jgi:hypothetical protein